MVGRRVRAVLCGSTWGLFRIGYETTGGRGVLLI